MKRNIIFAFSIVTGILISSCGGGGGSGGSTPAPNTGSGSNGDGGSTPPPSTGSGSNGIDPSYCTPTDDAISYGGPVKAMPNIDNHIRVIELKDVNGIAIRPTGLIGTINAYSLTTLPGEDMCSASTVKLTDGTCYLKDTEQCFKSGFSEQLNGDLTNASNEFILFNNHNSGISYDAIVCLGSPGSDCNKLPSDGVNISGRIKDENGNPISGATVSLPLQGVNNKVVSDSNGFYNLRVESGLPPYFAVNSYEPTAHNPDVATYSTSNTGDGSYIRKDFILPTIGGNSNLISMELVPDVHHLGDSNYSGSVNSQFQYPNAEGTSFSRKFSLTEEQRSAISTKGANLTFRAKGIECPNLIAINSNYIVPANSDSSGAYSPYSIPITTQEQPNIINSLLIGTDANEFVLYSLNNSLRPSYNLNKCPGSASSDYDDFEFANVQIHINN